MDNLTSNLAHIEQIITTNIVDPNPIFNLDEAGVTPGKKNYNGAWKRYQILEERGQECSPELKGVKRVNVMGVICGNGMQFYPLCIINGKKMKFQEFSCVDGLKKK